MTNGKCWHRPFTSCSWGNFKGWICLVIFLFVAAHLLVSHRLLLDSGSHHQSVSSSVVIVSKTRSISQSSSRKEEEKQIWRKMGIKHVASTSGSTNGVPLQLPDADETVKQPAKITFKANVDNGNVIAQSSKKEVVASRKGEVVEKKGNLLPTRSMTERSKRIQQVCRRRGVVSK